MYIYVSSLHMYLVDDYRQVQDLKDKMSRQEKEQKEAQERDMAVLAGKLAKEHEDKLAQHLKDAEEQHLKDHHSSPHLNMGKQAAVGDLHSADKPPIDNNVVLDTEVFQGKACVSYVPCNDW